MDISKKILSDPVNKWVFNSAQKIDTEAFLVGGYVRDLLRDNISKDKDFVLKSNVKEIASETVKKFNGTFIILKKEKTYRVVLRDKKEVIDFSYLKDNIHNDLKERDFTINAIAWSPERGIIDPFECREDLKKHIVKAVRAKNLLDDPLRIIRAYRIASELNFKIESRTRKYLKYYSKRLAKVASERITEEIFKLLRNENAIGYLNECYRDTVLGKIFFFNNAKKTDNLSKNIKLLDRFELFLKAQLKKIKGRKISMFLGEETSQGLNRLGLMHLALLTKDISISSSRLRVSNNINKALRDIHNGYEVINKIPNKEMYKIFTVAGKRVFEVAIILSFIKDMDLIQCFKKANEYIKIKNKILLNGNDIQRILNIKPGTKIGKILSALKAEQFKGSIKTKAEAESWLVANFT